MIRFFTQLVILNLAETSLILNYIIIQQKKFHPQNLFIAQERVGLGMDQGFVVYINHYMPIFDVDPKLFQFL